MEEPQFKLINLTPVGFKYPDYPQELCGLCRGPLNQKCFVCVDKEHDSDNSEDSDDDSDCSIIKLDRANSIIYCHRHCSHAF